MKGELTILLKSDTCFSMPATDNASVDIACSVDNLGLPTVSGKTLHGVLRDTWLSARQHIDPTGVGADLLGVPGSTDEDGVLRIGDAVIDDATRNWVNWSLERKANPASRSDIASAFFVKRTVSKIERTTGAPSPESLRTIRVTPKGLEFRAPLETLYDLDADQKNLLQLLCALTRHVGLHRNRGLGHVQLSVAWVDPPVINSTPTSSGVPGGSVFRHFRLSLTAPCLVSQPEIDPSMRGSQDFISGSAIRGAVAAVLIRNGADPERISEIVGSGRIRFLNSYVEVNGERSIPRPLTWRRDKDAAKVDDQARPADDAESILDRETAGQRVPLSRDYYASRFNKYYSKEVQVRSTTHHKRDRGTGSTAAKNTSTVFVYESIEKGQAFRGCLSADASDADLLDQAFQALVDGPIWLGRSRRAGYGGAPIIESISKSAESEVGALPDEMSEGHLFEVRLTSDAVLRDAVTGEIDPYQLKQIVATRFNSVATVEEAFVKCGSAGGYNALWRTELPKVSTVAAGSVVLLRADVNISRTLTLGLQATPLGERTAEGFGYFTIANPRPTFATENISPVGKPASPVGEILIAAQKRLYLERVRLLLSKLALRQADDTSNVPSRSLLQRLRVPLRAAEDWRTTFANWLSNDESMRLASVAFKALERARIGTISLKTLLGEMSQAQWYPSLGASEGEERQRLQIVDDVSARALWNEAIEASTAYYLDVLLNVLSRSAAKQ